jgi:nitrate/nitrite transporter NarK
MMMMMPELLVLGLVWVFAPSLYFVNFGHKVAPDVLFPVYLFRQWPFSSPSIPFPVPF